MHLLSPAARVQPAWGPRTDHRDRDIPKYFRGDAAFAIPALYYLLEEESFQCAIRIPASSVLMDRIGPLLTRPVGRPSYRPKMAEVAVPRELFAAILERIQRFGVPPPLVPRGRRS